jgi:hypothetical protein
MLDPEENSGTDDRKRIREITKERERERERESI